MAGQQTVSNAAVGNAAQQLGAGCRFKIGDQVVCHDYSGRAVNILKKDTVYTVTGLDIKLYTICLEPNPNPGSRWWKQERFTLYNGTPLGGDPIQRAARVLIEHDRKSAVHPYVPLTDEQWKRCVDRGEVADAITKATLVIGLGSTGAAKPPIDLARVISALKIDENNYRNGNYNHLTNADTANFIKSVHEWLTRIYNL